MAKPQPKNTEKIIPHQQYFMGGSALDFKMGIANSFYASQNLDFRTFPSQMSTLPQSRSVSSNLQDLILTIDQDLNGVRWAVGDQGNLYSINTNNVVSKRGQIPENGSAGLLYSQITDQLYIPGQTAVSLYGRCTSNPSMNANQWGVSASSALGCTALYNTASGFFDGGAGYRNNITTSTLDVASGITLNNYSAQVTNSLTNTYPLPSSIIEGSVNICPFSPDIEPFYSVAVYVTTIGTGNWTLTMHDSMNNNIGSATINHSSMVVGWNNFVFGSQVRALVNASNAGSAGTYHFHLTSSVSGDTAAVATYNPTDLSGVNMILFAYRLVKTNNTWHPTAYFTGTGSALLCIGNGNYLATYNFGNDQNPSSQQFRRHALYFTPGEEVCGLTTNYGYLVIGTERRSTNTSRNTQFGRLYFWSGSTTAPDFYIDLPMGAPYGLYSYNNVTYMEIAGSLYAWSGGQTVLKVRKLGYQNTDYMNTVDQTRVNPRGFTSRYNILMMGYPSFTTDPNLDYGIWSWGGVELTYPNSLGYSYSQSIVSYNESNDTYTNLNYTSQNNLKLGCCVNFVDSMYSSWQYVDSNSVTHSGLDVVDNSSTPASFVTFSSLIFDGGVVYKEKNALRYKVKFESIPTGWTLTPWWIIDRGTKQFGGAASVGQNSILMELNNARFHELQWGFVAVNDGTATAPIVVLGVAPEIDPLEDEVNLRKDV